VQASGGYFAQLPGTFINPAAYGGAWWFIGTLFLSGFAYVANASHWQRILSARSVSTAKTAFRVAIPVVFCLCLVIIFIGLSSHILVQTNTPESVLFTLMEQTLPTWSQGIAFAAIIAVLISSLDTLVISGATISYGLFFKKYELSQESEMLHARLITAIFGIMGYIVAALHPHIVRFSSFSTHISLIFAPPVIAALLAPRLSSNSVFYSLLVPFLVLIPLFPLMRTSTFLVTTPLSIGILYFYDRFFPSHRSVYKQKRTYAIK
ncbi:MAG TPA: hypothetical protein VK158_00285, partial [Acidobacteriota bacterium]|nr:hypothetical protein [Acidobacteriota bacterium]